MHGANVLYIWARGCLLCVGYTEACSFSQSYCWLLRSRQPKQVWERQMTQPVHHVMGRLFTSCLEILDILRP